MKGSQRSIVKIKRYKKKGTVVFLYFSKTTIVIIVSRTHGHVSRQTKKICFIATLFFD